MVDRSSDATDQSSTVWQVTADTRIWVGGHNMGTKRAVAAVLDAARRPPTGPIDLAVIAPASVEEAIYFAEKVWPRLEDRASLWIALPETEQVQASDFTAHPNEVIDAMHLRGFRCGKRIRVNNDCIALRFQSGQP